MKSRIIRKKKKGKNGGQIGGSGDLNLNQEGEKERGVNPSRGLKRRAQGVK